MANESETGDAQEFEQRSASYETSLSQRLIFDPIHRILLDQIPPIQPPADILDIGCGTGRLLRKIAQRWPSAHLIGVDPAEGMIAQARRFAPEITFYVGQAESLPLPDASLDLVVSTMSFHHWQDQADGIAQVARVLRKGGIFVLVDLLTPLGLWKVFPHGRQVEPGPVKEMCRQACITIHSQRRFKSQFILLSLGERD